MGRDKMDEKCSFGVWFSLDANGVVHGAARYGSSPGYQSSREACIAVAATTGVRAVKVPADRPERLEAMFDSLITGEPVRILGLTRPN